MTDWGKDATQAEQLNWMFNENHARIVEHDDYLAAAALFKVVEIKHKTRYIRATSEDGGVAYFKHHYYKLILDFVKPEEWFLTDSRQHGEDNHKYRLLVGRMSNGKYVLLAPIRSDPHITERFEK